MPEQSISHHDQFFQSHTTPAFQPFKIQRLKNVQAAQAPSPQRSPSYSPPPVAVPTAPKAMMYPANASSIPSVAKSSLTKTHDGRYSSHPTEAQHSSPMAAHKTKHQAKAQQKQDQQTGRCEEKSLAHTACQQAIHPIEMCDNHGCNGFHNHNDCPLEKRCWGCRSPNHFWSDCPMTCKECQSARHIPKYCTDFEAVNSDGIAHPRRPIKSKTSDTPAHQAVERVFTCDNYGCRDMHSHYDCPLESICRGCRSTNHFWASCNEICGKCGAKRHSAEYCHEFELWKEGLSRPKRPLQDVITYAMKRQREQGIDREQGVELPDSPSKKRQNASHAARVDTSPIMKTDKETPSPRLTQNNPFDPKGPARMGRHDVKARPAADLYHPPRVRSVKHESSSPRDRQDEDPPTRRTVTDSRTRDREYCAFWLRTGRCNYEHTLLGCKYKHEVPEQKTLQAMGIQFLPAWLREKERPPSWAYRAPLSINSPLEGGHPSRTDQKHVFDNAVIDSHPQALPLPSTTIQKQQVEPNRQRDRVPLPTTMIPKPSVEPNRQHDRSASWTPASQATRQPSSSPGIQIKSASQTTHQQSSSPGIQTFKSDRMKAFEEEEYFKQKRHEAEMKRKAEEQRLEYEHELKLAKLRMK